MHLCVNSGVHPLLSHGLNLAKKAMLDAGPTAQFQGVLDKFGKSSMHLYIITYLPIRKTLSHDS